MNKYIHFVEVPNPGKKTRKVRVINTSGDYILGVISWYWAWRQYVFIPHTSTLYNHECLQSIMEELKKMNVEQKGGAKMR